MESLPHLVKQRLLIDQLDDNEFSVFISEMTSRFGRSLLHSALFNLFMEHNHNKSDEQTLEGIVEIIQVCGHSDVLYRHQYLLVFSP